MLRAAPELLTATHAVGLQNALDGHNWLAVAQDAQHIIERLAKCNGEVGLNVVGEPITRAECGTRGDGALAEGVAAARGPAAGVLKACARGDRSDGGAADGWQGEMVSQTKTARLTFVGRRHERRTLHRK